MNNYKKITGSINKFKEVIRGMDFYDQINHVDERDKNKRSNKITLSINNKGDKPHAQASVQGFINKDVMKLIALDIVDGRFSSMNYGTKDKNGEFTYMGGGKFSRITSIKHTENGRIEFSVAIHEPLHQPNKTIKPGKQIDRHSITLDSFNSRKIMLEMLDYIRFEEKKGYDKEGYDEEEAIRNAPSVDDEQSDDDSIPLEQTEFDDNDKLLDPSEEEKQFLKEMFEQTMDKEHDDPIIPSGKQQGKKLSEVQESFKDWMLENVKGKMWVPVVDAIKKERGIQ